MIEKTDQELMEHSQEESEFYLNAVVGLPTMAGFRGDCKDKYGIPIPYGSSPHIVRYIRKVVAMIDPKSILEIGTNCGWSAALWLNICDAKLTSIDISDKDETIEAGRILHDRFPERFTFSLRKDFSANAGQFDLIFIDGGHEEVDVTEDIKLAKDLGIPYLLFDDVYPRFGPGTIPSIEKFDLELIEDMDNLRLYKCEVL